MSRLERKNAERIQRREEFKEKKKYSIKTRIEEFKLNRQGKTNKKRTDVMERYRRVDRTLTMLILIVFLLLIITWVIILFI